MIFRAFIADDRDSTSSRYVFVFMTVHALQHRAFLDETLALLDFKVLNEIFDQQTISFRYAFYFYVYCEVDFFLSQSLRRSNYFFDI
jgi:hypothetical protein